MGQTVLRPTDVPVGLYLAQVPEASYHQLGAVLGLSLGGLHGSLGRLAHAGLLIGGARRVNRPALTEFLSHGVQYAFPADVGSVTRGVPTAHSAPPLAREIPSEDAYVWPSADGTMRGTSVTPLYPGAPRLAHSCQPLYEALTLVDAIRLGRARERQIARKLIDEYLRPRDAQP